LKGFDPVLKRLLFLTSPLVLGLLISIPLSSCQSSAPSLDNTPQDSIGFIQPTQTTAAKAFTLQLLNNAYDSCNTTFTHTSFSVNQNTLSLSFVLENHVDSTCVADVRPYGPSYALPALAAGKYAVYASQQAACEYTNPMCDIVIAPSFVDTLIVSAL
jgi:hypothetical protein